MGHWGVFMKKLLASVACLLALSCMVGLAACAEDADGPHEHAFGAWETVTAATCTEAGEEERVCTGCGAKETRAVAPRGHRFEVRAVSAATCTEAGEEERVCTGCGIKETVAVAPLGHDVAEGLCALCGETFEATDADYFSFRESEDGSYAISDVAPGVSLPADVVIPWEYNGKPVTAIDDMVGYEDTSARTLLIPAGIVSVGDAVFAMCKELESVTLGRDVAEFGKSAFRGSPALASLAVAQSNPVFHGAGNCVIETQGKVLRVGCKESVIPADGSVTQIAEYAFYLATGLQHIEFPQGLTSIGDSAFNQCTGLTELVIPEGVTQIGIAAFCYCSGLESVSLPAGLSAIGWTAFHGCTSLQEISLPAGLETVEAGLFAFCSALERVSLPESITSIGWGAFYGCTALREIELPANLAQIEQQAFQDCASLGSIVIPEGVTQIGERAFQDCASLESAVIPDGVTEIGQYTFFDCAALEQIVIPDSVTRIGHSAFYGCSDLKQIALPNGPLQIGENAFAGNAVRPSSTMLGSIMTKFWAEQVTDGVTAGEDGYWSPETTDDEPSLTVVNGARYVLTQLKLYTGSARLSFVLEGSDSLSGGWKTVQTVTDAAPVREGAGYCVTTDIDAAFRYYRIRFTGMKNTDIQIYEVSAC